MKGVVRFLGGEGVHGQRCCHRVTVVGCAWAAPAACVIERLGI